MVPGHDLFGTAALLASESPEALGDSAVDISLETSDEDW